MTPPELAFRSYVQPVGSSMLIWRSLILTVAAEAFSGTISIPNTITKAQTVFLKPFLLPPESF